MGSCLYPWGEAQRIVGKVLRHYPRRSYVLAIKVYWTMGDGANERGLPEFVLELGFIGGMTNLIPNVWAGFGGAGCSRPSGACFDP